MIPIRVYGADLRCVSAGDCSPLLDHSELQRAETISNPSAKLEFMKTRAILRLVLSVDSGGVGPRDFKFASGANGKPYLIGNGTPHFNVSHSGGMALIALAPAPLGVDIELQNDRIDHRAIANTVFSASELDTLRRLPPSALCEKFFSLWTRKEAYLKATGCGFSACLDQISTAHYDGPIEDCSRQQSPERWYAFDLPAPASYKAALVTNTDNIEISMRDISGVTAGKIAFRSRARLMNVERVVKSRICAEMP